ncbi:hypothetical protein GF377_02375, partial [candidate division GN15 bacterium]|nr:hypothetical protein [candidate division GN15 bacterium]
MRAARILVFYLITHGIGLLWAAPAFADDTPDRIPLPGGVFYYQPAAAVFGPEAAWSNPAQLGRFTAAGFQVMADYHKGNYAKSWGTTVFRDRLVTAYRHIHNDNDEDFDEWLAAAGLALGQSVRFGFSYRYFREGPGLYNNRHFWTVGATLAGRSAFKVSGVWSNLNRGRVNGEQTAVEHRYSLAYRGISPKLVLAADMFLSSRNSLRDADFTYFAEYTPTPGLYLNGLVDSDRRFQVGLRVNLYRYFIGSRSAFDRGGHNGRTTVYMGATNQRQPSILPPPKQRLSMGIRGGLAENPPRPVFGHGGTAFAEVLLAVYRAADDPSIGEMHLSLRGLRIGLGQAQELRQALEYFRSRGKRIVCHLSSPNNIGYYVASAADSILIPPVSQLRLVGLRAELTFYGATLDKVGVNIQLLRIGDFKTAPERYTREAATEENRQQVANLLDEMYD